MSTFSPAVDYEISAAARNLAIIRVAKLLIITFGFVNAIGFAIALLVSLLSLGGRFIDESLLIPRVLTRVSNSGPILVGSIFPLVEILAVGGIAFYTLLTYTNLIDKKSLFRDAVSFFFIFILSAHVFVAYSNSSADADEMLRRELLFFGRSAAYDTFELLANSHAQVAVYYLFLALATFIGLLFMLHQRRVVVAPKESLKYLEVTEAVGRMRDSQEVVPSKGLPINRALGRKYIAGACGTLVGYTLLSSFLPASAPWTNLLITLTSIPVDLFVLFLLLRARQYYQISSDSYLDQDHRKPYLLLRSFADDTPVRARAVAGMAGIGNLLDFSIETRLASHFMRFGPLLAVGAPQDKRPQLGAPRVKFADADWQAFVMTMIDQSRVIIMLVGTTHWVSWELDAVVKSGRALRLVCIFPRSIFVGSKGRSRKSIGEQTLERVEKVKFAFKDTPWSEPLANVAQPEHIFATTFDPSGAIHVVRCRYATKDAFDLAAQIAHSSIEDDREADG
jgi:hypothetical protein